MTAAQDAEIRRMRAAGAGLVATAQALGMSNREVWLAWKRLRLLPCPAALAPEAGAELLRWIDGSRRTVA